MSKQSLAVKYRPQRFSDVVEQDVPKAILTEQLKDKSFKNCLLFCGGAGTGKTTSARIFGKEVNGFKGHLEERDAASNNGVDDVRKIINEARTQALDSEYKVFIIDECFHGKTLVCTPEGDVEIQNLKEGDVICNIDGNSIVEKVFTNSVSPERLILVTISTHKTLLTTIDHLFFTNHGWKPAKELQKGDVLVDYEKMCDLWERFPILSERQSDGMFCDLWENLSETENSTCQKEYSENNENLSNLSEGVSDISFREFYNLWSSLFHYIQTTERIKPKTKEFICQILDGISVPSMWEGYEGKNKEKSKILFNRLCNSVSKATDSTEKTAERGVCLCYLWQTFFKEYIKSCTNLFSRMYIPVSFTEILQTLCGNKAEADDREQSNEGPQSAGESETDETAEWNSSRVEWDTWWKWTLYRTSDEAIFHVNKQLGVGIPSKNPYENGFGLSNELQIGPCLTESTVGCRGRWEQSFLEIWVSRGCQESKFTQPVRVDCIEVYKRGNNEQSFQSYFTDTELHSDFVTLYDIQVAGHPSYFVEGVLVHNCHMISTAGWNAFLKLVEEPPKKSLLIFCTTDPQKIPATILSRVQRFNFQKISQTGIINRLKYIIDSENKEICESRGNDITEDTDVLITYEESAIEFIAKQADGGMRDAITLLDKCISYNNSLTLTNVLEALGSVNYDTMFSLTDALNVMDGKTVLETIESIHKSGMDLKQFMKSYSYFVLDLCKYDYFGNFEHLQMPAVYDAKMKSFTPDDFAFFRQLLDTVLKLNKDIQWETIPKPVIESQLLLLCMEG